MTYDNVLPVLAVASVAAAVDDLVLGHEPGVHDGVAALIPAAAGIGLTPAVIVAAGSGAAAVLEATAVKLRRLGMLSGGKARLT